MDIRKVRRAVRKVAKRNGVSQEQVLSEIDSAIHAAINTARINKDHSILNRWKAIPREGEIPTAYELLTYLAEKAGEQ